MCKGASTAELRNVMIYERFILELWYYHGTVILDIKDKIWASFKSAVSNKTRTWRLKRTTG